MKHTRILGIDPGLGRVGWGVIEKKEGHYIAIAWGTITTTSTTTLAERLNEGVKKIEQCINRYTPDAMGIEQLFFAKNTKTAMPVAHMRGAILLTAARHHLPIFEYTPLQVKQAVTGYGKAEKRQIQTMLRALLKVRILPSQDDAADALAIAYTTMVSGHTL